MGNASQGPILIVEDDRKTASITRVKESEKRISPIFLSGSIEVKNLAPEKAVEPASDWPSSNRSSKLTAVAWGLKAPMASQKFGSPCPNILHNLHRIFICTSSSLHIPLLGYLQTIEPVPLKHGGTHNDNPLTRGGIQ